MAQKLARELMQSKDLEVINKAYRMAREAASRGQRKVRRLQCRLEFMTDGPVAGSMSEVPPLGQGFRPNRPLNLLTGEVLDIRRGGSSGSFRD
jgi:hypothetical protein